jgi:hypothetical protein
MPTWSRVAFSFLPSPHATMKWAYGHLGLHSPSNGLPCFISSQSRHSLPTGCLWHHAQCLKLMVHGLNLTWRHELTPVCVSACVCVCGVMCVSECVCVSMCICVYVCMSVCMHVYVCVCVCVCVCVYVISC